MRPSTYRKYTEADIQYIKDHLYDRPQDVANALKAPYGTVLAYMNQYRDEAGISRRHPASNYYALYLRETDELVCSGSSRECASVLGIDHQSFYKMICRIRNGKTKKWDLYIEPYNSSI